MDVKVVRQGENLLIIVPKEFAGIREGDRLELIEAKPGIYTLVNNEVLVKPAARAAEAQPLLSPAEMKLLKKLDGIRYEERIPAKVQKLLGDDEKKTLDEMVKKGFVSLYRGKQYSQTGVYSIAGAIYSLLRNGGAQKLPEQVSEKGSLPWDAHLGKYGYVIIERQDEAKLVSEKLEPEIKSGEVLGTRGFDMKYYIAQKKFYDVWEGKIAALLRARKAANEGEVCSALGMSEVACRVALELMREQGEVIEKKKGNYALA